MNKQPNSQIPPAARISVILPVYRQADHITRLVQEYREVLERIPVPVELVLVPNGGEAATEQACAALADGSAIISVPLPTGGWGRAVKAGLAAATGDLLCYTNSSRTSANDLLVLLLYAIANPGTAIKANRKIREGLLRRLGSLTFNLQARAIYDLPMWDINGTPKIFPRQFSHLLNLSRDDDLIDLEFNVICRHQNYPVLEVPILSSRRHGGRSTTGLKTAWRLYSGAWQLRHQLGKPSQ